MWSGQDVSSLESSGSLEVGFNKLNISLASENSDWDSQKINEMNDIYAEIIEKQLAASIRLFLM